jgi:hypothetical protein
MLCLGSATPAGCIAMSSGQGCAVITHHTHEVHILLSYFGIDFKTEMTSKLAAFDIG